MDHRLLRFLILLAALLAGQWAGIVHASGHHGADGDEPQVACELCAVHGMWDHGLAVAPAPSPAGAMAPGEGAPLAGGRRHAVSPPFQSRAPPVPV